MRTACDVGSRSLAHEGTYRIWRERTNDALYRYPEAVVPIALAGMIVQSPGSVDTDDSVDFSG